MNYLVGDVQGCCDALERLLVEIDFTPSRDHLYMLGDLVNRGPDSLGTLRRLSGLGASATCLLGNHDLHLLAVAHGGRTLHRNDTLNEILDAPDRATWVDWLRHQHMAHRAHGWLMVHAGVLPAWSLETTLALAGEVETMLRSPQLGEFLHVMYGNEPTRIRFVDANGSMDLRTKEGAGGAPPGFVPWFEAAGRATQGTPIAFGHWSTLGLINRPDLLALDTGCVWGGQLTAARIGEGHRELIQVPCAQAQRPG
jgi:bis(5'-nucleosyl)-tetraphosphatase (symmetrical)